MYVVIKKVFSSIEIKGHDDVTFIGFCTKHTRFLTPDISHAVLSLNLHRKTKNSNHFGSSLHPQFNEDF